MSVAQLDVVDYLSLEKGTGHVVLIIADDLDWEQEPRHLWLLQEKINRYVAFIESGEVLSKCEETLGRPAPDQPAFRISVVAKHEPSAQATKLLAHAKCVLESAG